MRNLLSFVLGVISRLLYLLLRLILLLDRTICRIYDLPVWSRFAGVLRQAGRRRSVCALSVFGLLFLLPAAFSFSAIWWTMPLTELLTALLAVWFLRRNRIG